jgi:predicted dehydrogenase
MAHSKVKVGIIGCGNISGAYFRGCRFFDILEIVACADLDVERAREKAAEYGIAKAYSVAELLADPEIEIVINLTIPRAHGEVALAAVQAGKSVYNEKPLSVTREQAQPVLEAAKVRGVLVGCAPDTFLGGGYQTCRKLIDDGWIGEPIGATAFMMSHGPESWHPSPDFFYQPGGGPMFDMGPYYVTAMVSLLGPVRRVTGSVRASFSERTAGHEAIRGQKITVNVPTHVTGILDFAAGPIATITTSFDVWAAELPRIEIYGSEGTLSAPDPNTFGGPVRVLRQGADGWAEIPILHSSTEPGRGTGVADMAYALRNGRPHRASGALAYHVLDIMQTFHDASRASRHIELSSSVERPAPLPLGPLEQGLAATSAA